MADVYADAACEVADTAQLRTTKAKPTDNLMAEAPSALTAGPKKLDILRWAAFGDHTSS